MMVHLSFTMTVYFRFVLYEKKGVLLQQISLPQPLRPLEDSVDFEVTFNHCSERFLTARPILNLKIMLISVVLDLYRSSLPIPLTIHIIL